MPRKIELAPIPPPTRTDQEVWTEIYGSTIGEIGTVARITNLSKRKVTRVIELAHGLRQVRSA